MNLDDCKDDLVKVVVTEEQINQRLAEMGKQISDDYRGDDSLLLVGVLRGAIMVMADLSRHISIPLHMDWMAVSSYGASTKTSGVVRILKDLDTELEGRSVLIVEDIIDSGLTLDWLLKNLESRGAKSVKIATLLRKPEVCVSTGAHMYAHMPWGKKDGWKSFAVMERAPTGTRDCFWCLCPWGGPSGVISVVSFAQ